MRYRVDELAARCGLTVDTVRYYQAKGLLPRPEREGRVAWYGDDHVAVLERIRDLKARGLTLAMITRVLEGGLDPTEEALAGALVAQGRGDRLTLAELAERTGVSLTVLEAVEREGLLLPSGDADLPYSEEDAEVVRAGLALLEAGVPLSELLALAREHDQAMRGVADRAVDLFARFVRDPIRGAALSDDEAGQAMVAALEQMLPAASVIVSHHFRRRVLDAARARIEGGGVLTVVAP